MSEITYPRTEGTWLDQQRLAGIHLQAANVSAPVSVEALRVFSPPHTGRKHEPGARRAVAPQWAPHRPTDPCPPGWVMPDDRVTCAFAAPPVPIILPPGTTVRRVIGLSPDKRLAEQVAGSWWFIGVVPETEGEWRAGYAVPGHWNGDGGYVEVTLHEEVRSWMGVAAAHRSVVDGYVLPGGREQLWVPPGTIDPIRDGLPLESILHPTPWRLKEMSA